MKKKLLFVITNLGHGGTNRSLQNLLNMIDTANYEVDVFVMVHQGAYHNEFKNCTILPRNQYVDALIANYEDRKGFGKLFSFALKLIAKLFKRKFQEFVFKNAANKVVSKNQYDSVIGFSEGVPTQFVSHMKHHNMIAWVHCDYDSYMSIGHRLNEVKFYNKFKSIVCVSEFTRRSFISFYKGMANKVYAIYNVLDDEMMRIQAKSDLDDISFDKRKFNIISIGRIDPVKQLSIIPSVARELIDAGCIFCWYIIGPIGTHEEYDSLVNNVKKYKVKDFVKILGEKNNPYRYIANSDLLVNTSKSEACPYVINEAKILHKPVVCTNFGSAKEFIDYGVNGYYEPLEKLSNRIKFLMDNPDKYDNIKSVLSTFIYKNDEILSNIYSLINKK